MDPAHLLTVFLLLLGLALLVGEMCLPTGGALFVLAIVAVALAVAVPFFYGDTALGLYTAGGVTLATPFVILALMYLGPRMPMARRMVQSGPEEDATMATMPVNVELEQLRGKVGRALSDLRPSGVVEFDGRRIDCMSEGMLLEAGSWVRCIDVRVGKVIVRAVKKPEVSDLEDIDFS